MKSEKIINITDTFGNISVFAPMYLRIQPQFTIDMNALLKLRKILMYKKKVKGTPELEEYAMRELKEFKDSEFGILLRNTQYNEIRESFPHYFKELETAK